MTTLAALYSTARARLAGAGIETAAQDSRLLVEGVARVTPQDIICRPTRDVGPEVARAVEEAVSRRIAGEPPYRILGWREFHGLKLELSGETLEPRPDTETLVDAVLPFVRDRIAKLGGCQILDLGTGTGAIPLALLAEAERATVVATDIAPDALATAARNAHVLGLSARFTVRQSDWFSAVTGRFDLIVSNPPYIRSDVIPTLDREVRDHDPILALDGGPDGLDAYRVIASGAADHLADGGLVAVEIGFDQAESVAALFHENGFKVDPVHRDLGGNDRVLLMKMR